MKNQIKQNKFNKGFTLLELLVVVVIIGILAAIALPQYKKIIFKSHMASINQTLAAVKNAEERYYLMYSAYASDISALDIDIPYERTQDPSVVIYKNLFVIDLIAGTLNTGTSLIQVFYCPNKVKPWADCATTDKDLTYRIWLDFSTNPGKRTCHPATDIGTSLCKMLE